MLHESEYYCPECAGEEGLETQLASRRRFLQGASAGTAALLVAGSGLSHAAESSARATRPAEALVKELYASLSPEQQETLVFDWDHAQTGDRPSRLDTYNRPAMNRRIGENYSKAQQDLVQKILRSMLSGDEAFERLSRRGSWDGSRSFEGCGAVIFGKPVDNEKFSFVFSGHHLTLRCDNDSEPGTAFGGPMYYGHSAQGYSDQNVYLYQTKKVHEVFDALDEKQRKEAMAPGNPGDRYQGLAFRKPQPGISYQDLSSDQRTLVENVMRTLVDPYRKEDGDEVMQILKSNGGIDKLHLAFFADGRMNDSQPWHYWRLEGPGFVWNFRVLPHVHCYVHVLNA